MTHLEGGRIVLRPFRVGEVDAVLAAWQAWDLGAGSPSPPPDRERLARRLEASGQLIDGRLEFAIEVGGRLVGDIQARAPEAAFPPGVYEIGITIHQPADRGQGLGAEAIRLLTGYLFDELGAERVQAGTAVWNVASRRAFARVGFREEGVMRAFAPANDTRDDYVLLATTRADWARAGAI